MAQWYIGIDEHGNFNPTEKENDSFVCAVVTQSDTEEVYSALKSVYRNALGQDFSEKKDLLEAFHGIKQKENVKNLLLHEIWKDYPDLIKKIYMTEGRPYVVSNAQQWWLMGVQTLLLEILNSEMIAEDDFVNVYVGTRTLETIGFYTPIIVQNAREAKDNGEERRKLHGQYHAFLEHEIQKWLRSKCQEKVVVSCEPAYVSTIVSLADQAVNMARPSFKEELPSGILESALCLSFLPDDQFPTLLQTGDVLGAANAFLEGYFVKQQESLLDNAKRIFEVVNKKANVSLRTAILALFVDTCGKMLARRGSDGSVVKRVSDLNNVLEKEIEIRGIPSQLQSKYFNVLSALYAHSGVVKLDEFDRMERAIVSSNDFDSPCDRWKSYLELQLFKAQTFFNGYNFNVEFLKSILETQTSAARLLNERMGVAEEYVDDNYAAILGTLGQAAAFRGEYDEALEYFIKDYECTSEGWKSQVASYIFVVYYRQENWDKACEWFEKQAGMSYEQFGETFDSSSDMWSVLNYLRLYALGLRLNKALPKYPNSSRMKFKGNYPYGLVQKWAGICLYLKGDSRAEMVLKMSYDRLQTGDSYTIKSLALPVMKMRYKLASYDKISKRETQYKSLLEKCCESEHFVAYMGDKKIFGLDDDKFDIWETAMMLPFNYA
jgi:tetratricopeptide (TPR) repeat protein